MTIGVKPLVDAVNSSIQSVESPLQILQLSSVNKDFEEGFVYSVADIASLPNAANNKGRMVYVEDRCSYRISDGVAWSNDFTSVRQNFQAWAWGGNDFFQLGDGTSTSKLSPVSVIGDISDWTQISSGFRDSIGIRSNGTLWGWGENYRGQLGDNTSTSRNSPVSVVGGFTDWCYVNKGSFRATHAIRQNGTLWAWGVNVAGVLGDGTLTNTSSPVSVIGNFTDWCQVSSNRHSLGVRQNGTAWAWGRNTSGELGDNSTTSSLSPVSVVGDFTDWCQVSAGCDHSLGVRQNGTAWAWGNNTYGRLGDGTTTDSSSPVSVIGGFTDWCQVSAGNNHSLGVRSNGTAWAWGVNSCGRLGDGTLTNTSSPVSVVGGFTDWCQVSAGGLHSLGVRQNSTAWAWGNNANGRLGDGTTTDTSSPVSVVGGFTDWCQVSAGSGHSLALRSTRGF
jgi:alpha-tubulin suppressor-like RCC1 family protein